MRKRDRIRQQQNENPDTQSPKPQPQAGEQTKGSASDQPSRPPRQAGKLPLAG
jgi:hypothetical protein